jgi:hypothetical protein
VHGLASAWRKLRSTQRTMVGADAPQLIEECVIRPPIPAKLRRHLIGEMAENEPRMLAVSGRLAEASGGEPTLAVAVS